LKSIDKALDIDTGVSYDIIRPGVCDGDNPEYHIENAPLSEEDRDIVDKYTTYSKGLVDVDEDFIEDIRDILLVVIDNNYSPSIVTNMGSVFISSKSFGIKKDWDYYVDLFPSDIRSMKSSKINYSIQIKNNHIGDLARRFENQHRASILWTSIRNRIGEEDRVLFEIERSHYTRGK